MNKKLMIIVIFSVMNSIFAMDLKFVKGLIEEEIERLQDEKKQEITRVKTKEEIAEYKKKLVLERKMEVVTVSPSSMEKEIARLKKQLSLAKDEHLKTAIEINRCEVSIKYLENFLKAKKFLKVEEVFDKNKNERRVANDILTKLAAAEGITRAELDQMALRCAKGEKQETTQMEGKEQIALSNEKSGLELRGGIVYGNGSNQPKAKL